MADTWTVTADLERFDEAAEAFKKRVPMRAEDVVGMTAEERRHAFWVAGMNERAAVETLHAEIARAIEEGTPLEEFKARVKEKLIALHDAHLETVFRNAVQGAYNTGRWHQLTDPDVTLVRPYWVFDAVMDSRTSERCSALNGTIKAHDDPFWLTRWPPLHHRCRSGIRAVRKREARLTEGEPKAPDNGFGLAPPRRGDDPRPMPQPKVEPAPEPGKKRRKKKPEPDPRIETIHREREAEALSAAAAEAARDLEKLELLKRQDPAYWLRQYETTYGPEASHAVAWGRAMEERGLALSVADLEATHRELRAHIDLVPRLEDIAPQGELFARIRSHRSAAVRTAETVEGLLAGLSDEESAHFGTKRGIRASQLIDEVRALSALAGHVRSIEPARDPLRYKRFVVPTATSEAVRAEVERDAAAALAFVRRMADESLAHPVAFKVDWNPAQRAGYSAARRTIFLGEEVRVQLVHEWVGHGIEDHNEAALKASLDFFETRTRGRAVFDLSQRYPGQYDPGEVAREGDFYTPYVGRDYEGAATEIGSMGIEMVRAGGASFLLRVDPDHYYFVLGHLAGARAWPSGR